MSNSFLEDKTALSSVMATVIIAMITIAMVISASYWTGGLTTIFTRFEKVEVKNAYITNSGGNYIINIQYENTGSTSTSIDSIDINDVPYSSYTPSIVLTDDLSKLPSSCETGASKAGKIIIKEGTTDPSGNKLVAGVTLKVTLHTTGHKIYQTTVVPQGTSDLSSTVQGNPINSTILTDPISDPLLTISSSGTGSGTTNPPVGSYSYASGSSVTVSATATSDSTFGGWTLNSVSYPQNPITFTMSLNSSLVATFIIVPPNSGFETFLYGCYGDRAGWRVRTNITEAINYFSHFSFVIFPDWALWDPALEEAVDSLASVGTKVYCGSAVGSWGDPSKPLFAVAVDPAVRDYTFKTIDRQFGAYRAVLDKMAGFLMGDELPAGFAYDNFTKIIVYNDAYKVDTGKDMVDRDPSLIAWTARKNAEALNIIGQYLKQNYGNKMVSTCIAAITFSNQPYIWSTPPYYVFNISYLDSKFMDAIFVDLYPALAWGGTESPTSLYNRQSGFIADAKNRLPSGVKLYWINEGHHYYSSWMSSIPSMAPEPTIPQMDSIAQSCRDGGVDGMGWFVADFAGNDNDMTYYIWNRNNPYPTAVARWDEILKLSGK